MEKQKKDVEIYVFDNKFSQKTFETLYNKVLNEEGLKKEFFFVVRELKRRDNKKQNIEELDNERINRRFPKWLNQIYVPDDAYEERRIVSFLNDIKNENINIYILEQNEFSTLFLNILMQEGIRCNFCQA